MQSFNLNRFVFKEYNGKKVRIDPTNQYPNLTDICNTSGKKLTQFLRLKTTTDYIDVLSKVVGIPTSNLLIVGGKNTGTWGHPQLAIECAGWCSPELRVLMTRWIFELLTTGRVELEPRYEAKALPQGSTGDRVRNMSNAVRNRYLGLALPQDLINLPNWLTVTESLINLGEDPDKDSGSLVHDHQFRYWINRQTSDLYRGEYGEEPPSVSRKKGSGFCYPPSYFSHITQFRTFWSGLSDTEREQLGGGK